MVASESNPYIKSGGLADVTYSLSKELVKQGHEVSLIIPLYQAIKNKNIEKTWLTNLELWMGWRHQGAAIYYAVQDGITFYFIENSQYFDRTNIYGYDDDGERFAFFALMSKELIKHLDIHFDVIHVHDWQSAILPCLIKEQEGNNPLFWGTRHVLTIHNEAFQGMLDEFAVGDLFNLGHYCYENGNVRFKDRFSTLKAGIIYADRVTTVSPTHRNELLNPNMSFGLDEVLQYRLDTFVGIVNGIDDKEFDPSNDKYIYHKMTKRNLNKDKFINKRSLQYNFNLDERDGPIFGLVSRLTWQKGIDLVLAKVDEIVARGGQVVILGSGEGDLEYGFELAHARNPRNVGIYLGYSNEIAHKIYAGSDFFMMPSLFEPCGIGQLIALKYGTLPIVREVGGLKDTVIDCYGNLDVADGIVFKDFNYGGFSFAIDKAFDIYYNQEVMEQMRKNAFGKDHSWKESAKEYLKLYK